MLNFRPMPAGARQARIKRQQRGAELLGQSHVGGIVRAEAVPQLPNATEKRRMGKPHERESGKVKHRLSRAPDIQLAEPYEPA